MTSGNDGGDSDDDHNDDKEARHYDYHRLHDMSAMPTADVNVLFESRDRKNLMPASGLG